MMLKVDLHSHTNYIHSIETAYGPKVLIDKAVQLGYDAIAITEHYFVCDGPRLYKKDPYKTYQDFKDYAQKKGLLLIPGVELRFKEGEVVLFNFKGDLNLIKSIRDLEKISENTLRLAPHPFFIKDICLGKHLEKNIDIIDAIEYSHFYSWLINRNKKAVKVAMKHRVPVVGTSDAHRLYQLNHSFTLVDAEKNPDDIVRAIKGGRYVLKTKPLPVLLFLKIALIGSIGSIVKWWSCKNQDYSSKKFP